MQCLLNIVTVRLIFCTSLDVQLGFAACFAWHFLSNSNIVVRHFSVFVDFVSLFICFIIGCLAFLEGSAQYHTELYTRGITDLLFC